MKVAKVVAVVAYNHSTKKEEVVVLKDFVRKKDEIGEYIEGICERCGGKLSFYLKVVPEAAGTTCKCGNFEGIAYEKE